MIEELSNDKISEKEYLYLSYQILNTRYFELNLSKIEKIRLKQFLKIAGFANPNYELSEIIDIRQKCLKMIGCPASLAVAHLCNGLISVKAMAFSAAWQYLRYASDIVTEVCGENFKIASKIEIMELLDGFDNTFEDRSLAVN